MPDMSVGNSSWAVPYDENYVSFGTPFAVLPEHCRRRRITPRRRRVSADRSDPNAHQRTAGSIAYARLLVVRQD